MEREIKHATRIGSEFGVKYICYTPRSFCCLYTLVWFVLVSFVFLFWIYL